MVHAPLVSAPEPLRYSPSRHTGCFVQTYPLAVPPHVPKRYWFEAQLLLLQVEHAVSAAPEHPPNVYLPDPQVAQALHE